MNVVRVRIESVSSRFLPRQCFGSDCRRKDQTRPRESDFGCDRLNQVGLFAIFLFLFLFLVDETKAIGQRPDRNRRSSISQDEVSLEQVGEEQWAKASVRVRRVFKSLDQDGDLTLDEEEYVDVEQARDAPLAVRRRDFQVFDFDQNQLLSFREFSSIPGLVEAPFRGSIPDPFAELVAHAVAAMDESYDRWDQRPHELISAHSFVGKFLGSIVPMGHQFVTGRVIDLADLNLDGKVSRTEAKHFLEQQLGVRLRDGRPLRDPTGRVVRYDWFLEIDQNLDGRLSREEAKAAADSIPNVIESFLQLDQSEDGLVDYDEFSHPQRGCYFDPLSWFRSADTSLNGGIDFEELSSMSQPTHHDTLKKTFRAYDSNHDSEWSLKEYLLSPLANRNYPWTVGLSDQDGDGAISYNEFNFDSRDLFRLQRRLYFHRFDLNSDGVLSQNECSFVALRRTSFVESSNREASLLPILTDQELREIGGMSLHPDGKSILFHQVPHEKKRDSQIVKLSLNDKSIKEICQGRLPTWSPSGESFVCERHQRGRGIWLMESNGLSGRKISDGHAPAWSPDGTAVAYIEDHGIWLFELASKNRVQVFRREDHRHRDLGNLLAWSSDSRSLAFVGHSAEHTELFVLRFSKGLEVKALDRYDLKEQGICLFEWFDADEVLLQSDHAGPGTKLMRFHTLSGHHQWVQSDFFYGINLDQQELVCGRKSQKGSWFFSILEDK